MRAVTVRQELSDEWVADLGLTQAENERILALHASNAESDLRAAGPAGPGLSPDAAGAPQRAGPGGPGPGQAQAAAVFTAVGREMGRESTPLRGLNHDLVRESDRGFGFGVYVLGFRVQGHGLGFRVDGLGFRV